MCAFKNLICQKKIIIIILGCGKWLLHDMHDLRNTNKSVRRDTFITFAVTQQRNAAIILELQSCRHSCHYVILIWPLCNICRRVDIQQVKLRSMCYHKKEILVHYTLKEDFAHILHVNKTLHFE